MSVKSTVSHLPLTKARVNLGALIRRVHIDKEHFIRGKDGIPVAAHLDIDEYGDYLDQKDPALRTQIREGHREYRRGELTEDLGTFRARIKGKPKKRRRR